MAPEPVQYPSFTLYLIQIFCSTLISRFGEGVWGDVSMLV
jgi:hypothetical protein